MIGQGGILTRKSALLNHELESTAKVPPEERLEYKYVKDREVESTIERRTLEKQDCTVPIDAKEQAQQDVQLVIGKSVEEASKALRSFKQSEEDINLRLKRFKDSECPGQSIHF